MRRKFLATLSVLATLVSSLAYAQQTAQITSSNTAYLEYLPQDYHKNSNLYPVVISLHGIKEKGTTSTDPATLKSSVLRVANVGLPKNVKFGSQYPFILISPQLKTSYGGWPAAYVLDVINYVKKKLRIDPKRVYITGLSLGGLGAWTTLGAYPEVFAGAIPICAGGNALSKACAIASQNVPVWGFHGDKDAIVSYTVTTKMVNAINACTPKPSPLAKATLFPGMGHVIWDKVYKETTALSWMLTHVKGTAPSSPSSPEPSNAAPTVNAGSDRSLTLPTNTVDLLGTASDNDGIGSYQWAKISGGSASLSGQSTSKLKAYNLVAGTYVFRLTAKDTKGATSSDDVTVKVVSSSTSNSLPVVNAGGDQTITLPTHSVFIQGTASDSDGSITSYQWTKVSGAGGALSGATTSRVKAYYLKEGTYVFRLTVKDNTGGTRSDDVQVVVRSGSSTTTNTTTTTASSGTTNALPSVNAGPDKTITLPTHAVYLQGSASDSDGSIVSYSWTKISGTGGALSGNTTATARAYYLKEGTYVYRLTVKDNKGATRSDDIRVNVVRSPSASL